MPNFVYENVTLDFPKTDLNPLPPGGDPTKHLIAANWNKVCQAALDLKAAVTGGEYLGLSGTTSEPVSASGKARIRYDTGTGKVQISINGAAYVSLIDSTDSRLTDSRIPTGSAGGGQIGGSFPSSLTVIGVRETSGPTVLTFGAIPDGKVFARSGTTVVGVNGGHEIQNNGVSLTTRSRINLLGGLVPVDDVGGDATIFKLGGNIVRTIYSGVARDDNDTTTPKVVGAFAFNPAEYAITNTTRSIIFRAVAAPGNASVTGRVKLFNVTDSVDVVTVAFTGSTATQKVDSAVLTVPANLPNSEKVYEVHIYVDSHVSGSDLIIVYSAGLVVTNVVP